MTATGIETYPSSRLGGPRVRWHRTCWAIHANMLLFSVYFLVRDDVSKDLCGECALLTTGKMGRLCPQSLRQVWLDEAWYARFEKAAVEQLDESRPYQYAAGRRWL
jgi:hypothetical protein